jgi:hypothetical protein
VGRHGDQHVDEPKRNGRGHVWALEDRFWDLARLRRPTARGAPRSSEPPASSCSRSDPIGSSLSPPGAATDYAERFRGHCDALAALLDALEAE